MDILSRPLKQIDAVLSNYNNISISIFVFKLFEKTISYLLLPLSIFVVLIIRLISPFLLVRFQRIPSERLGHFAGNIEVYLLEKEFSIGTPKQNYIDFWCLNQPVSNRFFEKKVRSKLNCISVLILSPIILANDLIPNGDVHKIGFNTSNDRDVFNLFDDNEPKFDLNATEIDAGNNWLREIGLDSGDKFVCLHVRDSRYLSTTLPWWSWGYHNYRNCSIENYVEAAEELAELGYYVFRMGVKVEKKLNSRHPRVIDYACNSMRTDFLDVFLGARCEFCISNGSGFDAIPYIFRRPIVYVDHVPFGIINTFSSKFLCTTKKHWHTLQKRYLSLEEILQSDLAWHLKSMDFERDKIELHENSPSDICAVVLEMEARLSGSWVSKKSDERLQKTFWKNFPVDRMHGELRSRIGTKLLQDNEKLKAEQK